MSDQPPLYVVAEINNNGRRLALGEWSYEVFTDLAEARDELANAHDACLTRHRVYRLEPCSSLASVPAGAHLSSDERSDPAG